MGSLESYNPKGSDLRRAQLRMQEILDEFDQLCRRHNIEYWLISGTLLGARRHGGFIPWDDDIDVAVLQKDYTRLLDILKVELPDNLKLQSRETDKNYLFYWAKIRDLNSRYYEDGAEIFNYTYQGIFIDVFALEPVPSIRFKLFMDRFLLSRLKVVVAKSIWRKALYVTMSLFEPLAHLLIRGLRKYYKTRTSSVNSYSYGIFYYTNYNMKYFLPSSEIEFEGKRYKAPNNVDQYLFDKYGPDVMNIPDVSARMTHASKFEFY